ncbi:5-oxoprolinase subunit PxpB [Bacillus benzoevorans]|uniref:Inhibitor of KinA n=1 Tax=Bacillus benzoevorans TaxID=1456 RepID=A0A7X0LUT8_9BACI|nr:5-oxoprolinase subunit PxpB [Bacillus benzoevorans]MBB6443594.1 inhibitor of KinA [Bacillus benzoevorans]
MDYQLTPMGDQAIMIILGDTPDEATLNKVQYLSSYLDNHPFDWIIEYIPAFTSISIMYNPMKIACKALTKKQLPYEYAREQLTPVLSQEISDHAMKRRVIELPVCYGGKYGPDLDFVAAANGLTSDEVIQIHSSGDYIVQMIGFSPGFPYIRGMSEKIAAPRKETPRLKIPAQSVGIGGKQTGIYPIETPGGWQIIGRTPLQLFQPELTPPSLLRAGDKVKFHPISIEEFIKWEKGYHD